MPKTEKNSAVQEQKVFVQLKAVMDLQTLYSEVAEKVRKDSGTASGVHPADRASKQILERVIRTLDLPIKIYWNDKV